MSFIIFIRNQLNNNYIKKILLYNFFLLEDEIKKNTI